jgi:hypothetical protein
MMMMMLLMMMMMSHILMLAILFATHAGVTPRKGCLPPKPAKRAYNTFSIIIIIYTPSCPKCLYT